MFNLAFSSYAFNLICKVSALLTGNQSSTCVQTTDGNTQNGSSQLVTELPIRTSNPHHRPCLLPSDKEDDIPLTRICVIVLEEEGLIDTILLECGELDQQVQWTCKCLFKNQILLSSNLCSGC